MRMHSLYVSVGVQYDGSAPESGSLTALAMAVVNLERDGDPLHALVRPNKEISGHCVGSIQSLAGQRYWRSRQERIGVDPAELMSYAVDWLDAKCWLNYQPVLVLPDALGREYLAWYLERYTAATALAQSLRAENPEISRRLEPFYNEHLAALSAEQKATRQLVELRRAQAVRFERVS